MYSQKADFPTRYAKIEKLVKKVYGGIEKMSVPGWHREGKGYITPLVREFYLGMEKVVGEETLKSKVRGNMILLTPAVIASYLGYQRPPPAEITYPREGYESPKGDELAQLVCTDMAAYRAKGHYTQGMLKPKFALMNKMVYYVLYPRGEEKTPKEEVIQLVYELYYRERIDISLFIWEFVSRFPDQCGNSSSFPFK